MKNLSLYIHFPYCVKKCLYCDFLSAPADAAARDRYIDMLCREIALSGSEFGAVDTVFIGGGTPSLMEPAQLARVMEAVRTCYALAPDAEISMEVNPGTADIEKLRAYRQSGINRLSIGAQSFIRKELQRLGRIHTPEQIREVFLAAREAGFANINLDLMSALPGQTAGSWLYNLRQAVELGPEHLSCYSLIIEEGTPFAAMDLAALPTEEEDREMYHLTGRFLEENGYERYEISNYAREGFACRHNLGYWTGHDYLGLGLGASSCIEGRRFKNTDSMEEYARVLGETGQGDGGSILAGLRREEHLLSREESMEEFMFLGLRCTEGVSEEAFRRRFGIDLEGVYGDVLRRHVAQGAVRREKGRVFLSDYGLDVASYVMADYLF